MFQPKILNPTPDHTFVYELRKIDPDLRVVWGYERYFVNKWAIERKIPPERYFAMYESLLSSNEPRFIDRPIFDTDQPQFDDYGNMIGYKQVGVQHYDLAPEYEWVSFQPELNGSVLYELRRVYAWERNHPLSRIAFEKAQEEKAKQEEAKKKRLEAAFAGIDEALLDSRFKVQFGYGAKRNEE